MFLSIVGDGNDSVIRGGNMLLFVASMYVVSDGAVAMSGKFFG